MLKKNNGQSVQFLAYYKHLDETKFNALHQVVLLVILEHWSSCI